jgi:uncharacterized membrane protein YphA (DoxX/SURF4 family)
MQQLLRSESVRVATLGSRAILGVIFALSALAKLSAPGLFEADVAAYHLLPPTIVAPFAFALPWIEAMLAVYLILGLFLRPAALLTGGLLLSFTAAMALNLASGNVNHSCGCLQGSGFLGSLPFVTWLFGGQTITWFDLARDLALTGLALVVYFGDRAAWSLDGLLFGEEPLATGTASDESADVRRLIEFESRNAR